MALFEHHIFVCEHERKDDDPRGCCAAKDAERVRMKFKDEVSRRNLRGTMRANSAGCLNQCGLGVTVVIYPEQLWYGHVTVDDVEEILDRLLEGGEPVERLRISAEMLNSKKARGLEP